MRRHPKTARAGSTLSTPYIRSTGFGLTRLILFLFLALMAFSLSVAASADSVKIAEYEKQIKRFRYDNPDSAILIAQKGLELARRTHDGRGRAKMLNQLGMIDDNEGRPESSRRRYLEAFTLFRQANDPQGMAAVTIRLGVVELRKGSYDRAISYFLQALKISTAAGNKAGVMEANITLAEAYIGQHEYDTALEYLHTAEKLDRELPFSSLSLNICNNFGTIYKETKRFTMAIRYLEKGIAKSKAPEMQGLNITLVNNLATVYAKMGRREESIRLQKSALATAQRIQNYLRQLQTLTGLAASYGNEQEAIAYLKQALVLVRKKGDHKAETDILNKLADLYKFRGDFQQALRYKEQEKATADSFYYREMSQKIEYLQAAHELSLSRAKVQELKFQNSRQQLEKLVILSISFAVLLLMGVLVYHHLKTRKLNARLNQANTELKESNTVKDKLFSVLAHDLRSPLASILFLLEFINDDLLSEEEKRTMIAKLSVECNASMEMLNNLLKWGEMQIKGVHLQQENFSPRDIIKRTLTLLGPAAEKKSILVRQTLEDDLQVFSDPDQFEFIVRNLLSNAIKFTPEGGAITLTGGMSSKTGTAEFRVRDNGVGIAPDRQKTLFSISNISTKGTNDEKGSSLGLLMCKEFVEANHGQIRVVSEPGKGSEFIFTLPMGKRVKGAVETGVAIE